jgi:hypothetical protein
MFHLNHFQHLAHGQVPELCQCSIAAIRRLITNMDGIFIVYISYVPPSSLLLLLILLYYGPVMFKPNTFQHLEPKSGCFGLSL